ncbi:MAG: ethylbenzene dehydrogenase-related protein [Desulfobacterales bacterium]|nr:ethylbenzene dehydrogenase-related protein [Desulfobacterales bacterium]
MVVVIQLMKPVGLSAGGDVLIINAMRQGQAPRGLDDAIWQQIRPVQVPVKGRGELNREGEFVTTRAIYTDDSIFFHLQWKDPTRSIIKQSWQYDGKRWFHMQGNEDRIALLFEITRINKFASRGCAVTCHSPADLPKSQWKFATSRATEKGDLWHWKAARSDPYKYADDAWLTVAGNPTGSYRETGRRKDAGSGGDINNQTGDGLRPLYMPNPARKDASPEFLLKEDAIPIKDYSVFQPGTVIPFRLPVKPNGSRFDVKAESRYQDGQWSVMLYRKLDTGHEDDVKFNPKKRYSFAMAVFDDSGDDHSKATKALLLVFDR